MLAQRRPDEQVYVGPTSVSNVGPTESTTEKLRWPNVVMLSGKAVVAGPAGPASGPDHFFGRICYPPYHFFAVSAASVVLTCDLISSNHQKCRV